VSSNLLGGTFPQAASEGTELAVLNLGNNLLSGTIPPQTVQLTSLRILDLGNNTLDGGFPDIWMDAEGVELGSSDGVTESSGFVNRNSKASSHMASLEQLDMSGNRLDVSIGEALRALSTLASIQVVKVSSNALGGSLDPRHLERVLFRDSGGGLYTSYDVFPRLFVLEIGNNGFGGSLPATPPPFLAILSAANNNLTGSVSLATFTQLYFFDLRGNAALRGTVLSSFEKDPEHFATPFDGYEGGAQCHGVQAEGKTLLLDPGYFDFAFCECVAGFSGQRLDCTECPPSTFADEGGLSQCEPCPPNAVSETRGLTSARQCQCEAGFTSDLSVDDMCVPCGAGNSKASVGNQPCDQRCPEHATSLPGAITADDCFCEAGFIENADGGCVVCPDGFDCAVKGQELRSVPIKADFWRAAPDTMVLYDCAAGFCGGGSDANATDGVCADGHTAPLCSKCLPGYAVLRAATVCEPCDARSRASTTVAAILVLLGALLLLGGITAAVFNRRRGLFFCLRKEAPLTQQQQMGSDARIAALIHAVTAADKHSASEVRAADDTLRQLRRGGDDDLTVLTKLKLIAGMWQVVTQFPVVLQVRGGKGAALVASHHARPSAAGQAAGGVSRVPRYARLAELGPLALGAGVGLPRRAQPPHASAGRHAAADCAVGAAAPRIALRLAEGLRRCRGIRVGLRAAAVRVGSPGERGGDPVVPRLGGAGRLPGVARAHLLHLRASRIVRLRSCHVTHLLSSRSPASRPRSSAVSGVRTLRTARGELLLSADLRCNPYPHRRSYLVADLGTRCGDAPGYRFLQAYALAAALVFSLGIPLLYLALLGRHWSWSAASALEPRTGSDVADLYSRDGREEVAHLDFLFGSYKPAFWWFEVPVAALASRRIHPLTSLSAGVHDGH